jgi:putative inorganic carbon (HCO3(-)) transporter
MNMCNVPRFAPANPVPLALQLVLGVFIFSSTFTIAGTQTALGLALVLWFFFALKRKAPLPRRTMLDVPLLLFIAVSLSAALLSDKRLASLINLRNFALMSIIYLIGSLLNTRRMALRLITVLLVSGAGVAVYGIAIYLLGKGSGAFGRTPGPFSNAMTFGGILLILCSLFFAVAVGAGVVKGLRWAAAGAAIATFTALFFSFTRSSWVGAVVSVVIVLAFLRRRWLVPFAAGLAIFVLLLPAQYRAHVESIWSLKYFTNVHRLELLRGGLGIIKDNPVIGVGTMDLADTYRRYMPPGAVYVFGHMHNIFLQVTVQSGFVGLAAFCWLILSFFRLMARNLKLDLPPPERAWVAGSIGALAGFIVNGLFEWNFGDAEVVTLIYVILGANLALARLFQPAPAVPREESAFAYKPPIG